MLVKNTLKVQNDYDTKSGALQYADEILTLRYTLFSFFFRWFVLFHKPTWVANCCSWNQYPSPSVRLQNRCKFATLAMVVFSTAGVHVTKYSFTYMYNKVWNFFNTCRNEHIHLLTYFPSSLRSQQFHEGNIAGLQHLFNSCRITRYCVTRQQTASIIQTVILHTQNTKWPRCWKCCLCKMYLDLAHFVSRKIKLHLKHSFRVPEHVCKVVWPASVL